ncbi:type II toxin-antitoxin system HipA family toxin YjjJ [Tundrisphaera lichenicola]|uniref:type II toxin-antitoxin system HipA family toxin YjjJ n=1 Tax=Tundrisphaera lichenicola TaxID=2029860 RepID=UPI003EC122A3
MEKIDRLLVALRRGGLLRGEEIQRELGISQPVMSRLMREAGPRVCRFGRSVATRYALPREIAGIGRNLPVFRVDENGHPNRHGILHLLSGGGSWLERTSGDGQEFPGLPPFVEDMRPQGYIGRSFPSLYPELRLPERISDWNDDHQLISLASRGEDCVGDLIIGEESLNRFLAWKPRPLTRADFPNLATGALAGQPGSSAGGEHPKFAVYSEGRYWLVKFASGDGAAADRWRDLLVCEHVALEVLQDAGFPVPHSEWFDLDGTRYLQVDRFDRIGAKGRRGVISLFAVNSHFLGYTPDNWSRAGQHILDEPDLSMSTKHADQMIWLDTFGDLIANGDRHFGNFCFFADEARHLTLTPTPVYDMLPMAFAPTDASLVERQFNPRLPTATNMHLWHEAADHAIRFWSRLSGEEGLSSGFQRVSQGCRDKLARLIEEYP